MSECHSCTHVVRCSLCYCLAFAELTISGLLWWRQMGRTDPCTEAVILVGPGSQPRSTSGTVAVVVITKLVNGFDPDYYIKKQQGR
jgi:hypothetical protein